jgi:hypothetical protein
MLYVLGSDGVIFAVTIRQEWGPTKPQFFNLREAFEREEKRQAWGLKD